MNNNSEKDTKKVIDRLSTTSSSVSSHSFDLIDKGARKLSDYKENRELKILEENQKKKEEEEKLNSSDMPENDSNNEDTGTRLKTSANSQTNENTEQNSVEESTSKLKTNVNNKEKTTEAVANNEEESDERVSKLKTSVSKVANKVFKFNDNQGKVSKTMTIIGKSGSKVSKAGKTITRTSRELNKAINNDGTGAEYIKDKIGRKIKTKGHKIVKKGANKIKKKFNQTIGKKLVQVAKTVIVKLLKMLISLLTAVAEFIIPIALVILIIVAIGSIFGSSSSDDKSLSNYSAYMQSVQNEYNKQVDDWKKDNPDGIVVGVKGEYGQIDWRIPLAIIQSTNAELSFDQNEKNLLEEFKNADLLEKHVVEHQKVDVEGEDGTVTEKEIPVLVITNGVYEDYIDWCQSNYSKIASFNKNKKVTDGTDTWFSNDQLDILEMLYQSDDYAELLGSNFKTYPPSYGKNETKADLKSDSYNSKNTLTTAGFKGQCTWYSFGRALELFDKKMPTGNAQTWITTAIAMGYRTGTQPSVNSVVVLMGHKFGHVAFVESYDGKSITISEGNVSNPCSNDDSCSAVEYANEHAEEMVRIKTYDSFDSYRKASKNSGLTIIGFIYLD